jgi:hypothetical protein
LDYSSWKNNRANNDGRFGRSAEAVKRLNLTDQSMLI